MQKPDIANMTNATNGPIVLFMIFPVASYDFLTHKALARWIYI